MAITWMDGFDLYSATVPISSRYTINNSPGVTTGRFAGQACSLTNAAIGFSLPAATATLSFGQAHKVTSITSIGGSGKPIWNFRNVSTLVVELILLSTGALRVTRNGTVLGTSAGGVIVDGVWNYIEMELTRNASTGAYNVYVNGASVLSGTGANTGSLDIDNMNTAFGNDGVNQLYDDFYVTNVATKLGESRIDTIRPNADTADKDWARSTGADNYALVDETTYNGDTDYVSSATPGDLDIYGVTDLSFTPATVRAVQTTMVARKDDATSRSIRTKLKSGATTSNGATRSMTTSYVVSGDIFETDPDTAGAWSASSVNAAQVGIEVVT